MATTPVDSGGTQRGPSPMVAVPGAREAPVILGTGIGMSMPKMECKINLRSGNQDAWRQILLKRQFTSKMKINPTGTLSSCSSKL